MQTFKNFKVRSLVVTVFLLGLTALVMPISCATVGKDGGTDMEKMDRVISTIQGIEHSLKWVAPIACGVVAVAMDPAAAAACRVAQTALDALVVTTDQAVSSYQGNPSPENAQQVTDILGRLQDAWKVMDAVYKGDPTLLKAHTPQSRVHPLNLKCRMKGGFPISFGPPSAQASVCLACDRI